MRALLTCSFALVLGFVVRPQSPAGATEVVAPIVAITAPADWLKLREGRTMPVRVRVGPGTAALRSWTLRLVPAGGAGAVLASGSAAVHNRVVVEVRADDLERGSRYSLILEAADEAGKSSRAAADVLVPDPQYTLIPLNAGNLSRNFVDGWSLDSSGNLIAFGGAPLARTYEIFLLDSGTGQLKTLSLPLASSEGHQLTRDGRRYVFSGIFRESFELRLGLGMLDLDQESPVRLTLDATALFGVDGRGEWIAFQSPLDLDPKVGNPDRTLQYFLYHTPTAAIRQLTADPQAIDRDAACPRILGTTPLVSADGTTVVFATSARLGLAPTDGCHLFAYDIASATLRHVARLPGDFDIPALSNDGRWLSFVFARFVPPDAFRALGALIDTRTGALTEPIGGILDYPTYDAVISGDGTAIMLSTQADVDPRVGNPDHNMEVFVYEHSTGTFTQVSDTTGGIGQTPNGCPSYRIRTNVDARVAVFAFAIFDTGPCELDGPQRQDSDDLVLGRVRAVRRRPGNRGPQLDPLPDIRLQADETLTLPLQAPDPDGDHVYFFGQMRHDIDMPPGAEIEDPHDGTAILHWTPPAESAAYRLRIAAFDEGGGEAVQDLNVTICKEMVANGTIEAILPALFDHRIPARCQAADANGDGVVTAADLVAAGTGDSAEARAR